MSPSATRPSAPSRIHVSLDVGDLPAALHFYGALLGGEPTKLRDAYARFESEDPAVHLSLLAGRGGGPRSGHYGIQVESPEAVRAAEERLRAAGLHTRREDGVSCCHAVQTKVWAHDPDGHRWEVFVTLDDAPLPSPGEHVCCTP